MPFTRPWDAIAGMMKIVGAEPVTKGGNIKSRQKLRQPIPTYEDVDDTIGYIQKSLQRRRMKFKTVVFERHLPPGGNPFLSNRTAHLMILRST